LGSKSALVKMELLNLLKDNHEEVLQGLIPHISEILDCLLQNHVIGADNNVIKKKRSIFKTISERLA
jgi:hypothetical protein